MEIKEETDIISIAEAVNALTLSSESNISEKISCAKNNEFEKCSPTSDNTLAQKTQPKKQCFQFNSLDDKTQSDEIDSILISEISEVTESAENLTDLQVSEQNLVKSETEKSMYDALCKIQSNSDSKHSKNTENHSEHKKNELDMINIKSSTESQINEPDSTYEHHSCEIDSLNVSLTNSSSNNKSIYSGCETPVHGSKNSTSKFNKNVEHKLPVENSSVQEAHAVSQQSDILNTSHCLDDFEREFDENNGQNIQLLRNEYKKNADVPKTVAPNRENLIIDEVNNSTQIPDIVKSHIETKKSSDITFESEKTSRSVESPETYSKNTLVSEYSSDYKNKFETDVLESPAVFFEDAVFPEKEFETSAMKDSSSKVDIQSDFERASQKTISSGEIQSEVEEYSIDEENEPKVIPNLISPREELNDSFQFKNTDSKLIFDQFNEISEKISDNSQEKYNDNFKNSESIYLDDHKSKPNKITGRIEERDIKCTENLYSYSQKVADIGSVVDKLKDSSLSIESESKEFECISSPFVSKSNESDHNISQKISDICSEESKSSTDIHSSSNKSNLNCSDSKHNISSEELNTDNEKSVYHMNKTNCNQDENNKSIDFKNEDSIIENLSCSSDKSNLVKEENIKYGALEILKSSTKILQQNRKFETCSDQNEYSFDSSENQIEIEVIEEKTEESPSKSRSDGLNYTIEKIKIESTSRERRPKNTTLQEIFASNEETDGANKEIVSDEKSDYSYKAESKFSNDMKNQTREEKSVHVKELSVFISNDVENINELNEVYSNQENIPATLGVKTINSVEDVEETSKNEELKEHENITFSLPVPSLSDESLLDNVTLSNIVDVTSSIDGQYVKIEKSVESDDDTVSYEESFADDSKSKHSSSSDNSQVSGNDSVHTSGENSSSGSIDVRKRVREILADVSPVKNGQKSPRVQDLWVTTYDVPSSPDCSPESASPMKDVPTANLPSATESIVSEAEELRRKQLEIEQEIKELEKQQNDALPFVYVREIPNKPPPPYTPPSPQLTPSVPKSEKVPILMQSKTVTTIVTEIANTLYDAYSERNLADVEPSVSFYTLEERDDIDVSSKRFLFDLCKDVVMNELIEQDEDIPSWRKEKLHRNVKRPKSKSEFTQVVDEKVKQLLGLSVVNRKENLIICWSRKKRDHVDELLVRELQVEEAEWTNFDNDEITVKNELTDDIFNLLIADTVSVTTIALEKKFENLTSL